MEEKNNKERYAHKFIIKETLNDGRVIVKEFYGRLVETEYLNGKIDGTKRVYTSRNHLDIEATFRNGENHGTVTYFHDEETPQIVISVVNGEVHGSEIHYYPDGQVRAIIEWNKGKKVSERSFDYVKNHNNR